jgi:Holliday junction resolvase RusA-like endonuclease
MNTLRLDMVRDIQVSPGQIVVTLDYPGSCLSVNHYKIQGRFTRPETKYWMEQLSMAIKLSMNSHKWQSPLTVRIDGLFKDRRSTPDMHNLMKCIADAVQQATGINDKDYKTETGVAGRSNEPKLIITVKQGE